MQKSTLFRIAVLSLLSPAVLISTASAYQFYSSGGTEYDSENPTTTGRTGNCATCHNDYRRDGYLSSKDDHTPWSALRLNTTTVITSLHDIHRRNMGIGCSACHTAAGLPGQDPLNTHYPVSLSSSDGYLVGTTQEYTISCGGCHDAAGLRQHHQRAGVSVCAGCHTDSTTVGENVQPSYYALVDPDRPQPPRPKDPCNADFGENFAGSSLGLDNDGNLLYDLKDPACASEVPDISLTPAALMFGTVPAGTAKTLSTVIENKGVGTLHINVIDRCAATSTEFTWSPELLLPTDHIMVAPSASTTLNVTYAPVDDGVDKGCLVISSNDPDEPTMELGLNQSASNIFLYMPAIIQPAK